MYEEGDKMRRGDSTECEMKTDWSGECGVNQRIFTAVLYVFLYID